MNRDCVTCKHSRKASSDETIFNYGVKYFCRRNAVLHHDVVTGEEWFEGEEDCRDERYRRGIFFDRNRCGVDGRHWELADKFLK